MEKEAFSASGSLERGPLSRLPSYRSSRIGMSFATTTTATSINPINRTITNVLSFPSFRVPFLGLSLRHSDLFLETKAGTCPRSLYSSFEEEEGVQRAGGRGRGRGRAREAKRLVQRRDRQQSRALYRRVLIKFNVVERN